jgi:hypothetical protein
MLGTAVNSGSLNIIGIDENITDIPSALECIKIRLNGGEEKCV